MKCPRSMMFHVFLLDTQCKSFIERNAGVHRFQLFTKKRSVTAKIEIERGITV